MRWFGSWQRKPSMDRLIVSWSGQVFSYVQAELGTDKRYVISRAGVLQQGSETVLEFQEKLQALNLQAGELHVMLRPEQYQLLQIDLPAVPPEELRAAARYQIKDMVDAHLDDLTIDVMRLGESHQKGGDHLYVVAAPNAVVREMTELAQTQHWPLTVIDIQEIAHRNLQSLVAQNAGVGAAATAALMVISDQQALLTISANGELYYSRRLDLPDGFLQMNWSEGVEIFPGDAQEYVPVAPYEPDYSGSTSVDYSDSIAGFLTAGNGQLDRERAQRFLVEVQRSLDLWDRNWAALPLSGVRVYAGTRSLDLAAWLSQATGQTVGVIDLADGHPALQILPLMDQIMCLPLLGTLMRSQAEIS